MIGKALLLSGEYSPPREALDEYRTASSYLAAHREIIPYYFKPPIREGAIVWLSKYIDHLSTKTFFYIYFRIT
jgi:hypothetical protein